VDHRCDARSLLAPAHLPTKCDYGSGTVPLVAGSRTLAALPRGDLVLDAREAYPAAGVHFVRLSAWHCGMGVPVHPVGAGDLKHEAHGSDLSGGGF
jgi:hypothetical protein